MKAFLVLSAMAGLSLGDIIISVAPPENTDSYLDVLSRAWPRIYPQLDGQLKEAEKQVPAEYSYLKKILDITEVPATYNDGWARSFIDHAQKIGPTTIHAQDIPGADKDPGAQPTDVVVTDGKGHFATITDVPVVMPTIVVAINGNVARQVHDATSDVPTSTSDQDSSSDSDSESSNGGSSSSSSSSGNGSSDSGATTATTTTGSAMSRLGNGGVAIALAAVALGSLF